MNADNEGQQAPAAEPKKRRRRHRRHRKRLRKVRSQLSMLSFGESATMEDPSEATLQAEPGPSDTAPGQPSGNDTLTSPDPECSQQEDVADSIQLAGYNDNVFYVPGKAPGVTEMMCT
ncbi:hypothetical protein MTO96_049677 [Rhipicephalus appendiculatus]